MAIKLQQLRHLIALDEQGSFVQASAVLHISQPALSRSIQVLEAQVGAPLFLRDGHGVVATDLGRLLLQRARQITRLTDALHEDVLGRQALMAQELVIGAGPFPAATVVGAAVARFISARPELKVRVEVRNWDELLVRLKSHEMHMFIAESSTLDHVPDLHVEPVSRRQLYFIARRTHPLVGQASIDLGRLFQYPTAALARMPPRFLDPMLSSLGQSSAESAPPRTLPSLLCTDMSMIKKVVANSDAIMVASLACVAEELERGEVAVLRTEPWMQLQYSLVTMRNRQAGSDAFTTFRDYLFEAERAVSELEGSLAIHLAGVAG